MRCDGRRADELRPISFKRAYTKSSPGSVLVEWGRTKVLCTATIQPDVPEFLKGTGRGWLTAEYSMLPGSTSQRKPRERTRIDGRSSEIQRIVGRSLRAVVDLEIVGPFTIWVDCDVLEADGGTRTASVSGGFVAMVDALESLQLSGVKFAVCPIRCSVAAVSAGIVDGVPMLDLCYLEDSRAEVDLNIAITSNLEIVDIQGTAEGKPFSRGMLEKMLALVDGGIPQIFATQREALKDSSLLRI
jgi:ribonuclease PH